MTIRTLDSVVGDQLASTPEIFRLLMSGVPDEEARRKPASDRWSLAEVLEHLSHVEGHCFRARLDRMLAEDRPQLDPYEENELSAAGVYSGRDPEESFAHWEEQREDNVELLRSLDAHVKSRSAVHPSLGVITVEHLLNDWACHDLGHVRQVAELVRAGQFYPKLGPLKKKYSLRP
jgi:hypothetical protein